MKTKIIRYDIDWVDVKNSCRTTINKDGTENEPTADFKKKLLMSEHSPICQLNITWIWEGMKSWISVHFARHWLGWLKWISTQRNDRQQKTDRNKAPQDTPVNMKVNANSQALINVSRRRLCYQASPETREYMEDCKAAIHDVDPYISDVMQKNCVYRCGCPEFESCGYWDAFVKKHKDDNLYDLQHRYDLANQDFYEARNK